MLLQLTQVELGANTTANCTIEAGATKATVADILWRDLNKHEVGYWRFDGLQYLDTRTVTTAMDAGWRFEAIGDNLDRVKQCWF